MLTVQGMNNATDIVIGGCSAGGLSTWLHADWIKENLLDGVVADDCRVSAIPDRGFFIDSNGIDGISNYSNGMKWVWNNGNMSYGSIDNDCIDAYGGKDNDESYKCIFAQNIARYVDMPIFVLNSQWDFWAVIFIMFSLDETDVNEFGKNFSQIIYSNFFDIDAIANDYNVNVSAYLHGGYIDSCFHHCFYWDGINYLNYTQATAHYQFYQQNVVNGDENAFILFQNYTYPCDTCCGDNIIDSYTTTDNDSGTDSNTDSISDSSSTTTDGSDITDEANVIQTSLFSTISVLTGWQLQLLAA